MSTPSAATQRLRAILLAGLALLVIAAAFALDGWTRQQILSAQGKGWKKTPAARVQGAISRYGDWPFLMVVGGVGFFVARRLRHRDWQRILVAAMLASSLAGIIANASRLTTGRTRPNAGKEIAQDWYGPFHDGRLLVGNPKYNSFPSGHTATAVGFAGVLLFARPLVGLAALLAALAIAWSRMQLGQHHLSDVMVSTVLALFVAWLSWRTIQRHGEALAAAARARFRRRVT